MIDVVSVKPMGGYTLRVGFSDGSIGVHDFSSTAARDGEMVRPLKDPAFFARVFVELGALTWPNGYDLDRASRPHGGGRRAQPRSGGVTCGHRRPLVARGP